MENHLRWLTMIRTRLLCGLLLSTAVAGNAEPPPKASESPAAAKVPADAAATVVSLFAFDQQGKSVGIATGFFVSKNGRIATVRHLLNGTSRVIGETSDGRKFNILGVAIADPEFDLVILQADLAKTPVAKLGSFAMLRKGMEVRVVGNQFLFRGAVPTGKITNVENLADEFRWFAMDALIAPGYSGSPVFTESGVVVGMAAGDRHDPPQTMAVSVDAINRLLSDSRAKAIERTVRDAGDGTRLTPLSKLPAAPPLGLLNDDDFLAALAAFGRNDNAEAVRRIKRAIERFPESPACHVLLGSYQSALKNWPEAEAAYERAIELRNDYADAWGYLGAVLSLQGKVEPALIALRRALAFKPASENSLGALCLMCIVSKRYAEAHSALKKLEALPTKEAAEKAAALKKMLSEKERK